jgi:hypothetical protein
MSAAEQYGPEALMGALEYASAGYAVGPVTIRWDSSDESKRPTFHTNWGEVGAISADPDVITSWARTWPGCGFHMPCGPNGVVVPEGDVKRARADGAVSIKDGITAWRDAGGPTPIMRVRTPSGGEHWYFAAPAEDIHGSVGEVLPGVDVRGVLDTVFIAGTRVLGHPNGAEAFYWTERVVPASELSPLPPTWERRLRSAHKGSGSGSGSGAGGSSGAGLGNRVALAHQWHDQHWIEGQADEAIRIAKAARADASFRDNLYTVTWMLAKAAGAGVVRDSLVDEVTSEMVHRFWDAPNWKDRDHVRRGRKEARDNPWRLIEEPHVDVGASSGVASEGKSGEGMGSGADEGSSDGAHPGAEFDDPPPPTPEERELERALRDERARRDARRLLQAEDAPALRVLGFAEFLDSPIPEGLIPGLFYRDSLSRVFGAPGSAKSFLALDLALRVASGRPWREREIERGIVYYVMAEGQRVNTLRTRAWLEREKASIDEVEGRFFTIPDAVMLTEEAAKPFIAQVESTGADLVVLDTKNAMMVGEESSATDFATLRRVLDRVRVVTGACVVLIDHTGYEGTRARGSSAGTAAMDTEVRVEKRDGPGPAHVTVTVTRDKAAEAGAEWFFHLRMAADSAVLVPTALGGDDEAPVDREDAWRDEPGVIVPTDLLHYEGEGGKAVPDLSRYMAAEASPRHGDPGEVGRSRVEAERALKPLGHSRSSVHRAWSTLVKKGAIDPAMGVKAPTGRHVWTG